MSIRGRRSEGGFTLIELLIVIIIIGILSAIAIPMYLSQRDKAKDSAVKAGAHTIELGIASYATDSGDLYPLVGEVTKDLLVDSSGKAYVDDWPVNPWTTQPMGPSDDEGDYTYERLGTPVGSEFRLTAHLSDGGSFSVPN